MCKLLLLLAALTLTGCAGLREVLEAPPARGHNPYKYHVIDYRRHR